MLLISDESKRRTVFELRMIDGPLVLSAVDANPCCLHWLRAASSNSRFLFDSFGPVIQTLEDTEGCFKKRVRLVYVNSYYSLTAL